MSEIEQYWKAIAAKSGVTIQWYQLHPQMQMQVIEAVNLLLHVLGQCQQQVSPSGRTPQQQNNGG